jgi:anti-sigma factor RsiW
MRDLLPGYVHGRLPRADRLAVAAHLAACVDCAAEAALIEAASRAFPAPAIDIEKIVRALPSARGHSRHGWFTAGAWRAAAAIGLIALGAYSVVVVRGRSGATSPQTASAPVPGSTVVAASSNARSAGDSPARALPSTVSSGSHAPGISFGGGLSDLTDEQLDTLLGELDALDSLPSAEPESHLTPIVPMADGGHNAR